MRQRLMGQAFKVTPSYAEASACVLVASPKLRLKKAGHTGPPGVVVVETLGRRDMGGMFDLNNSALPLAISRTVILNLWVTILWKVE